MVQKAKKTPTSTDRLRERLEATRELYALSRIRRTPAAFSTAQFANFGGSAGGTQAASGAYLETKGDTMIGPIAYFPIAVSINGSDELDITPTSDGSNTKSSSYVIAAFASPDKIQKIIGAQFAGQQLWLQVPASSTLTLEDYSNNATGNIVTTDGTDVVITTTADPMICTLVFDVTLSPNGLNGGWVMQNARSSTGTGMGDNLGNHTATQPILPDTTDTHDIGSELAAFRIGHFREIEFIGDASTPSTLTDNQIAMTTSGMTFNLDVGSEKYLYYFDGTVGWDLSSNTLTGSNIILSDTFTINDSTTDPSAAGQFTRNGADVKVFSGGAVRNLTDIGSGAAGANIQLSNLDVGNVSVNTDIGPAVGDDGLLDIGYPTASFSQANIDSIALRHNDGLLTTVPSIGRSSNALRLNSPTGNSIELEINGVDQVLIDSLGMQIDANKRIQFNATNNASINKPAVTALEIISSDGLTIESGPGSSTPQIVTIRGDIGTDELVPSQIIFEGDNSAAAVHEYGLLKVRIKDPTSTTEESSMEFEVYSGGSPTKFLELEGQQDQIIAYNELFMNSNKIGGIGTATITDLTEELAPTTGDFIFGFEATSGAMRKFDIGNLPGGGGGGANTALSNLITTSINQSLLPGTSGTLHLGGSSNIWDDLFTEEVRFSAGGVVGARDAIMADAGGMVYLADTGLVHEFYIDGNTTLAIEENAIAFTDSGKQHRIDATTTSIQVISENTTDSVELWTGSSRSNPTVTTEDLQFQLKTSDSDLNPFRLELYQNNDTPATQRVIGSLDGYAENSASTDTLYGRIEFSTSNSITSGSESGRVQIEVRSNSSFVPVIEVAGNTASSTGRLGFFGTSEVDQQSVASDTLANLYTALRNYGLIA